MRKIIVIQCTVGLTPSDFDKLWKSLYAMSKAGILMLPEYCKLLNIVEIGKNDN